MPRVRTLNRQVQEAPRPAGTRSPVAGPRLQSAPQITNAPSPELFGAGFGRQLAAVGGDMLAEVRKAQEEERQKQEQARFDAESRALQDWEIQNVPAVLATRGQLALGAGDKVGSALEKFTAERRESLGSDELRGAYDNLVSGRRQQILLNVLRHEAGERESFNRGELASSIGNHQSLAVLNAGDPVRISDELDGVRQESARLADLLGLGPEETQALVDKNASATHRGVIAEMAKGSYLTAQMYYNVHKGELGAEDKAFADSTLEEATRRGRAYSAADRIWAENGNGRELTRTKINDLTATIQDPEERERATSSLLSRWNALQQDDADQAQARMASAKDAMDQAMQGILNAIDQGRPRDMAGVHKLIDQVAPGLWAGMNENQRSTAESYAKKLTEDGKIETDQKHWYALWKEASDNPDSFIRRDLNLSMDKVSAADFQELAKLQGNIKKDKLKEADAQLGDFRTENQVINDALGSMGIDPGIKENQAIAARVHQMVAERARALAGLTGEKVGKDEIERIADDIITTSYTKDGWIWDTEKPLVTVQIGDVPKAERKQIEEALRGMNRVVTDEAIVDLYIRTQQRLKK